MCESVVIKPRYIGITTDTNAILIRISFNLIICWFCICKLPLCINYPISSAQRTVTTSHTYTQFTLIPTRKILKFFHLSKCRFPISYRENHQQWIPHSGKKYSTALDWNQEQERAAPLSAKWKCGARDNDKDNGEEINWQRTAIMVIECTNNENIIVLLHFNRQ